MFIFLILFIQVTSFYFQYILQDKNGKDRERDRERDRE